jgi:REP element-mobilizing transposase RayT
MSSYPTRRRQRLAGFDYSTPGTYFVTLCVQDRLPLFGRVVDGRMHRSPAGDAIERVVGEIPGRFPGATVEAVMTMPDHLHLLLSLDGTTPSLSEIVHWFKSQSTARYAQGVRDQGWRRFAGSLWQRGFHDRVIRTDEELNVTREYMMTNPVRWALRHEPQEEGGPPHASLGGPYT